MQADSAGKVQTLPSEYLLGTNVDKIDEVFLALIVM